jgi:hypothetical protein
MGAAKMLRHAGHDAIDSRLDVRDDGRVPGGDVVAFARVGGEIVKLGLGEREADAAGLRAGL